MQLENHKVFVEGMSCNGCEDKVIKAIKELDGISHVQASYEKGEVSITLDPEKTNLLLVKNAITSSGYAVREV